MNVDFDVLVKHGKYVAFSDEKIQEAFPYFQEEENNGNGCMKKIFRTANKQQVQK